MTRGCAFCGAPTLMPPYVAMHVSSEDKTKVSHWFMYPPCCDKEACLERWEPHRYVEPLSLIPQPFYQIKAVTFAEMGGFMNMAEA